MREKELKHFEDAAAHLRQATAALNLAYAEATAVREPGMEFSDEVYALSALQTHVGVVDTQLYRKIEFLKGSPRVLECGCCVGGCLCWQHSEDPKNPPKCDFHKAESS